MKGVGVPEDCPLAVKFLEVSANAAAAQIHSRGFGLFVDGSHLSDAIDTRYRKEVDEEVTEYYRQLAEEGDDNYAATLGTLYLQGSRLVDQNMDKAVHYLRLAAKRSHVHSSALLGYLIAQGRASGAPEEAVSLLEYAKSYRDITAIVGLAYCMHKGVGTPQNDSQAFEAFRSIAEQAPDAAYYMGEILMHHKDRGGGPENVVVMEPGKAVHAYAHAAKRGHTLATHRMSHMALAGLGTAQNCEAAANGFKEISERGDWAKALTLANRKYLAGDPLSALQQFMRMAAIGIEAAQANAAFLLTRIRCSVTNCMSACLII